MSEETDNLSAAFFSELFTVDQIARNAVSKALPKGMELSHFVVLNLLARSGGEKTPAQLARGFSVTRGAMTNTLSRLEWAGHVHIRPDWDDARRKFVSISDSGRKARDEALLAIAPVLGDALDKLNSDDVRRAMRVLRDLRRAISEP